MGDILNDESRLLALAERPPRYAIAAYEFTREAVSFASHVVYATGSHVTGPELLQAIRRFARERYGVLAGDVLASWGLSRTEDFGDIVFRLVEAGFLSKTEDDRPEDFRAVYRFEQAFDADAYWRERLGDPSDPASPSRRPEPSRS